VRLLPRGVTSKSAPRSREPRARRPHRPASEPARAALGVETRLVVSSERREVQRSPVPLRRRVQVRALLEQQLRNLWWATPHRASEPAARRGVLSPRYNGLALSWCDTAAGPSAWGRRGTGGSRQLPRCESGPQPRRAAPRSAGRGGAGRGGAGRGGAPQRVRSRRRWPEESCRRGCGPRAAPPRRAAARRPRRGPPARARRGGRGVRAQLMRNAVQEAGPDRLARWRPCVARRSGCGSAAPPGSRLLAR